MAAVENAPLDSIYTLFRADPSALKHRRITKREADYERVLRENSELKRKLADKNMLEKLQRQLELYEGQKMITDSEEECNDGERKRPRSTH
jgi:hypothetical protein